MTTRLRSYQAEDAEWAREQGRVLLAHEQGVGKTPIAAMALRDSRALVICPAAVVHHWRQSLDAWRPDLDEVPVVSYDLLHRRKIKRPRCLVVDECHYVKNPETIRSQYVLELARTAEQVIFLSGTPVPNRPMEFWPVLYSVGAIHMDPMNFGMRFCNGRQTPWGMDYSGHSNLDELRELIRPFVRRRTKADVLPELPRKQFRVIPLDLPGVVRNEDEIPEVKEFKKRDLRRLDFSIPKEILSTVMRLHGEAKIVPAVAYVDDLLNSGVEKVVVGAWHKDVIAALKTRLGHAGHFVVEYKSGSPTGLRQAAIDQFQEGSARVIVGNMQAMGTGITLTAASHQVLIESNWSPGDLLQWSDRCHRIGQEKNVTIDVLTVHESIDEHVLRRVLEKKEVTDSCISDPARPSPVGTRGSRSAARDFADARDEQEELPF